MYKNIICSRRCRHRHHRGLRWLVCFSTWLFFLYFDDDDDDNDNCKLESGQPECL